MITYYYCACIVFRHTSLPTYQTSSLRRQSPAASPPPSDDIIVSFYTSQKEKTPSCLGPLQSVSRCPIESHFPPTERIASYRVVPSRRLLCVASHSSALHRIAVHLPNPPKRIVIFPPIAYRLPHHRMRPLTAPDHPFHCLRLRLRFLRQPKTSSTFESPRLYTTACCILHRYRAFH